MKLLGEYQNGNYTVLIYDDGTKIKETINSDDTKFIAKFPESMDVKITNYCDMNCLYCHENSNIEGLHGDILHTNFINTLHPHTEMAIGGGNPLSHPDLIEFLKILKSRNIISNMTINQKHFMNNQPLIKQLINKGLIKGLGVSFNKYSYELLDYLKQYDNVVLHIINGIIEIEELKKLYNKNLKILILGYKQFRRGNEFYSEEVECKKLDIHKSIKDILISFDVVSFDNLAIKQIEVKRLLSQDEWNEFYMGDDGSHTMYIDMVNKKFALNSTSVITYDLLDNIDDMFEIVNKGVKA